MCEISLHAFGSNAFQQIRDHTEDGDQFVASPQVINVESGALLDKTNPGNAGSLSGASISWSTFYLPLSKVVYKLQLFTFGLYGF